MAKAKRTNVSMVQTADSEQSNNWDFPVHQEELVTSQGVKSGIHAVIRGDTQAVIGQYKGNKVLPYNRLVETFELGLEKTGLKFSRSFLTTSNGARFFGRYDIGNGLHVNGEGFRKVISLQSSHDGSLTPGYSLEIQRLACLNGMMGLAEVFALFRKHSENLDIDFIQTNIVQAIESGEIHAKQTIEQMSSVSIRDNDAQNILSNIVKMGSMAGVSERSGYLINHNWRNPSPDEIPLGDTLYRLYNAATRFTRDVANVGRFEMSRRANMYITGAFDLAVRRKSDLEKLLANPIKPLEFDKVIIHN